VSPLSNPTSPTYSAGFVKATVSPLPDPSLSRLPFGNFPSGSAEYVLKYRKSTKLIEC
jgi:hypothetical protein